MADTVKDALIEALNEGAKTSEKPPVEDKKVPEPKIEVKEPTPEPEEEDEDENIHEFDASPEELRNALSLFRSIADPKTRKDALKQIAQNSGINLETKADERALEKSISDILREQLGDSYELLSGDKLGAALERIVSGEVTKATKPLLDRVTQSERAQAERQANTAMDDLWKRKEVSDPKKREEISGRMMQKMKNMPPGEGASSEEYLDDIFSLVNRDEEVARGVKDRVTRIRTNAKDVSRTSGEGTEEKRVKMGSNMPSVKESVAAAFRGERFED